MKNSDKLIALFSSVDEELIKKNHESIPFVCEDISDSLNDLKYEAIRKYFPKDYFHFSGDNADFALLTRLRKSGFSESLALFVEALICKCRGHFRDSLFPHRFLGYFKGIFDAAADEREIEFADFHFFISIESSLFKRGFNHSFERFVATVRGPITVNQMYISESFVDLYSSLNMKNRLLCINDLKKWFSKPIDNSLFVYASVSLIKKLIEKNVEISDFKLLYAKVVDVVSLDNPKFDVMTMQEFYQTALDYLAEIQSPDVKLFDSLSSKFTQVNRRAVQELKLFTYKVPDDQRKALDLYFERITESMKAKPFGDRVYYLLALLEPFNVSEMHKQINSEDKRMPLLSAFPTVYLDVDGNPLNYDKSNLAQKFSLRASTYISSILSLFYNNVYLCFLRSNRNLNPEEIVDFSTKIAEKNRLIEKTDVSAMATIFTDILSSKFSSVFGSLCTYFEKSLCSWFSSLNISTRKIKPHSNDRINLNDIFNFSPENRYAAEIKKIIDEDYFFTLTWLLTDEYGRNLRNNAVHGKLTGDNLNSVEVLFASLQIFKFYLAFER